MADYPIPVFHFEVKWGGTNIGFTEVSGLNVEVQPIEYRTGEDPSFSTTKRPGLTKFGNITMKRGVMAKDNEFSDWLITAQTNIVERRDLTISLMNEKHEPVMVWNILNAFPTKVESPSLKADGNEIAIESIELAHEGLSIVIS